MGRRVRATKIVKISALKNVLSRVVNAVSNDEHRVLIEKNGVPVAAIVSVSDLKRLVDHDRRNRDQEDEDSWAVVDRMREAFKDVPDEEIERETDRIIARIRAENREARAAAREALAATG
jgi:prevent-host-death family protein